MTPKQRVACAIRRSKPDCVPVISQISYLHEIRALGLDFQETILDCIRHPSAPSFTA